MRGGVDQGFCLTYFRLSWRRKFLRNLWMQPVTLGVLLILQLTGFLPAIIAVFRFPHPVEVGWAYLAVCVAFAPFALWRPYNRWQEEKLIASRCAELTAAAHAARQSALGGRRPFRPQAALTGKRRNERILVVATADGVFEVAYIDHWGRGVIQVNGREVTRDTGFLGLAPSLGFTLGSSMATIAARSMPWGYIRVFELRVDDVLVYSDDRGQQPFDADEPSTAFWSEPLDSASDGIRIVGEYRD